MTCPTLGDPDAAVADLEAAKAARDAQLDRLEAAETVLDRAGAAALDAGAGWVRVVTVFRMNRQTVHLRTRPYRQNLQRRRKNP